MGRKRKQGTEWLPERVYIGKSAYEFRPKNCPTVRLAALDATQRTVIKRWEEESKKLEQLSDSFAGLVDEFFNSPAFKDLAISSQKKYLQNAKKVNLVFGKVSAQNIKPQHIRIYMDKRGAKHQVTANREKSFMSKVFSWGYERGKVTMNPCKGVKQFTETSRDRYINDAEYRAVQAAADPITAAVMEISYCCAARVSDVLSITREQIREEGLYIKQGKTGKAQIKAWTPRLRSAVDSAKAAQKTASFGRVVANESGQRITYDAFRERWRKAKVTAATKSPSLNFDFTFHDIKAKAISDWNGDKKKFSGHKSESQVAIYDRKVEIVDSHE